MNLKFCTLIASLAVTTAAHAFTIDFNALQVAFGTTVNSSTPLTVNIAGYGDVKFEVTNLDELIVDKHHSDGALAPLQNSLELDSDETVVVTFLGAAALNVDFDIIGIDGTESTEASYFAGADNYQYSPGAGIDGTGIARVTWNTVPEPSSSLLVLVGAGSLILRRRR